MHRRLYFVWYSDLKLIHTSCGKARFKRIETGRNLYGWKSIRWRLHISGFKSVTIVFVLWLGAEAVSIFRTRENGIVTHHKGKTTGVALFLDVKGQGAMQCDHRSIWLMIDPTVFKSESCVGVNPCMGQRFFDW